MFVVGLVVWLAVAVTGFAVARWRPSTARRHRRTVRRLYALGVVAAGVAAAAQLIVPPVRSAEESGGFSVERAQGHIQRIAARPHPIGTPANNTVRIHLMAELRELGLEPVLQATTVPDWYGSSDVELPVVNVIARVPGTDPTGSVLVVAHFDTVPTTPGANDNASGVAIVLETARSLTSGDRLRNDVILLFSDGEEPAPKYGSRAFLQHEWFDGVRFVVNLEAIGTSGPSWITEIHGPQSWVLGQYVDSALEPAAFSFLTATTELIGGSNSDFAVFRDAGIPGVEFAYGRGSSRYHSPADTPESVDQRSLFSQGANTIALVRRVASIDLSEPTGSDMIFFTVGQEIVVHYPAWWSIPVAGLAGLAVAETVRRRGSVHSLVRGTATVLARLGVAVVVAVVLWISLAGWRSTMGVAESTAYLAALGLLTVVVMIGPSFSRHSPRLDVPPESVLLVFVVLASATSLMAPGMSYLFVFPPLAGALALPFEDGEGDGRPALGPAVLSVGTWFVLAAPVVDIFYQFAQPRPGNPDSQILPIVAVPLLLVGLAAALAHALRVTATDRQDPRPKRQPIAGASGRRILAPGREPWDPANGLRVGALTGALAGGAFLALTGGTSFWVIAGCAVAGGCAGFWIERRKQRLR